MADVLKRDNVYVGEGKHMMEKRTSLFITDEIAERISALSQRTGVPQGELMRRCLAGYLPALEEQYRSVVAEPKKR